MQLITPAPVSPASSARTDRAPRQRLPAPVRGAQILDAALQVFTEKGFASARMDDIAQQAGLSKGGVYAHFKSKEDIFLALLERLLSPAANPVVVAEDEPVTVDLLVERVIRPGYAHMAQPESSLALRLLLADARNMQQHVQQWHERTVMPHARNLEQLVQRGVREGTLRASAVTQAPWFILVPNLHALLSPIILGQAWHISLAEQERIHIAMLRELLTP